MKQNSDILIYRTKDNEIRIETRLKDETVWLNRHQLAEELFNKDETASTYRNNKYKTS